MDHWSCHFQLTESETPLNNASFCGTFYTFSLTVSLLPCYLFSSLVEFGSRGTFTKYWFWKTFSLLKPEKQWVDPVAETIIDFPVHCRFIIIYEKNSEQTRSGLTDSPVFLGEWFEYCGPAGGGSINKLWRSYYHFNTTLALIASLITEKHHIVSTQSVAVRERISPSSEINEWSRLDLM